MSNIIGLNGNYNFANILIGANSAPGYNGNPVQYINVRQNSNWNPVGKVWQQQQGKWVQLWPTEGVVKILANTTITVPPGIRYVDVLTIGGGGGGGVGSGTGRASDHNGGGGGGGAGGVEFVEYYPVSSGQQYNITFYPGSDGVNNYGVGASAGTGDSGGNGGAVIVTDTGGNVLSAAYGGIGGRGFTSTSTINPLTTGSGGGGYSCGDSPGVSPPTDGGDQGYAGGYGATNNSVDAGGGGGGAGAAGGAAAVGQGGKGGDGVAYDIANNGTPIWFAGGGGGGVTGHSYYGTGGIGGGGNGGQDATNYGSGGGGNGTGGDSPDGIGKGGDGSPGAVFINFYAIANQKAVVKIDSGTGHPQIPSGSEINYGGGGHSGGCFTDDTLVSMADGTFKKISDVKIGEQVYNRDKSSINTVVYVEYIPNNRYPLYAPTNKISPFATINHPLYIDGELKSTSTDYNYPWLNITGITPYYVIPIPEDAPLVYNLWLDGDHTYIVNGFGTHSIIDDGGCLPKLVFGGKLTHEEAMSLLEYATSDMNLMYGCYIFIKIFNKLDTLSISAFLARSLLKESFRRKLVVPVIKITGYLMNLIKRFR
jgi:hypothetical protein